MRVVVRVGYASDRVMVGKRLKHQGHISCDDHTHLKRISRKYTPRSTVTSSYEISAVIAYGHVRVFVASDRADVLRMSIFVVRVDFSIL